MDKRIITVHRVLFWANVAILAATLVYYLIRWGSLPEEIGVHFGSDGTFDVVEKKIYGFYPHIICGAIMALTGIAGRMVMKRPTGLKISERGERLFKAELLITLDVFLMVWTAMFSMWSLSVSTQTPLDIGLLAHISTAVMLLVLIGVIAQIVTCIACRQHADTDAGGKNAADTAKADSSGIGHRLCRIVPWLLCVGCIAMTIEGWDRHPADDALYFNSDYYGKAYYANFGTYMDKNFLAIPPILMMALLTALEVIGIRSSRAGKKALTVLTDRAKLINGVFFFWWCIILVSELGIGYISVTLYIILLALSAARYITTRKTISPEDE